MLPPHTPPTAPQSRPAPGESGCGAPPLPAPAEAAPTAAPLAAGAAPGARRGGAVTGSGGVREGSGVGLAVAVLACLAANAACRAFSSGVFLGIGFLSLLSATFGQKQGVAVRAVCALNLGRLNQAILNVSRRFSTLGFQK